MSEKTGRPSRRAKRRKRRKALLIIEIILLLILLGLLFFWLKFGMINFKDIGDVRTNKLSKETEEKLSGYTNFMLYGIDNRTAGDYDTGRTDVQMIVSINNDTKKIRMASIYRDTVLDIDPSGTTKFYKSNAAYAYGGEKQAIEMVNANLDLNIEKFVAVDFKAVVDVIDAVGGVEVDVSQAEYEALNSRRFPTIPEVSRIAGKNASEEYVTQPGLQTLDGVQACAYCRIRHGAGDDYARAKRQRKVMGLVFEKVKSASLSQLSTMIDKVLPQVSTNFSTTEIIALAAAAKSYSIDRSFGFPFDKAAFSARSIGGASIIPCTLESNAIKLHEKMFDEMNYAPSDTVESISQQIVTLTGLTEANSTGTTESEGNIGVDDDDADYSATSTDSTESGDSSVSTQ